MTPLKGTKVLVTGGAGFVGSYVVEQLLAEGASVVVIDNFLRGCRDNLSRALPSGRVHLVEADIRDRELLDELMSGAEYCFHLAALRITQCAAEPRQALEVMYDGTFNVLESCVKHSVKRLVFASSASVYGQADDFPTSERHHPYNNATLYGAAKMANELMCRSFLHMYGLPFNALRYFNIYGPRMDTFGKYTEVLIRWYHLIREGKRPLIYGDGSQTMDFVYIEDVARATLCALKTPAVNEVFNVAEGKETSLKELCHALLTAMGSGLQPEYVPIPQDRKKVEVLRRRADVSKAKNLLEFETRVSLEEGLRKLVVWLDSQTSKVNR